MPRTLWDPAAGDGAIVLPLRTSGRTVYASDIHDYGLPGCHIMNYLTAPSPPAGWVEGIVGNPPYGLALDLAVKALAEVPYVALLVRTNWLLEDSHPSKRGPWLDANEPTRQWWIAQRLPMMHRHDWTGKKAGSNTPYAWAVWERGAPREFPRRVYWRELLNGKTEVA